MDFKIGMRFYRVERKDDGQPDFADCLRTVCATTRDEDQIREIAGVTIGSAELSGSGPLIWGDLLRHQKENLPSLLPPGKPPAKLELPEGAGLGHHTAFIYDPATGMLGYQLTRTSVSMERFNLYVTEFSACSTYIFVPVIRAAELRALARMKPKTFIIKVADPVGLEAVEDEHKSLRDSLIHLHECMEGAYIRITVGMGRKKGFLEGGMLRSTIGWLLEQRAKSKGKVQVMKVEGKNLDESDADPLNFLKAHVGVEEMISLDGLTPAANFEARLAFMKRAASANAAGLKAFSKV